MPHAAALLALITEPGIALPVFALVTIIYLVLAFLVLMADRATDLKLIMLGLLTGVAATWCALLAGEGISVQGRAGQPGQVGLSFGAGGTAVVLGRIAVLLVLGGLAIIVWTRWYHPPVPSSAGRDVP